MEKKRSLFSKIYNVIIFTIVLLLLIFWREIYQGIMYTDICLKYMAWQEHINEIGNYKLMYTDNNYDRTTLYCNKEKTVVENFSNGESILSYARYNESDIPGTVLTYSYNRNFKDIENVTLKTYMTDEVINEFSIFEMPYISFEKKSFWDLFKTGKEIMIIRVIENNNKKLYEIYLDYGARILVDVDTGLVKNIEGTSYNFEIGTVSEDKFAFPENCQVILADYEDSNRNKQKTDIKISNCEEEAGKAVSYDFQVENINSDTLWGFMNTSCENIKIAKIMNHVTYKKFQDKFNLRNLTEEDFKNYFVMLAINTDSSKKLEFKELQTNPEKYAVPEKTLHFTETTSENSNYECELIVIPNSEDSSASGATILGYDVSIE